MRFATTPISAEIIQLVGGVAKIQVSDPAQVEHLLQIVLDGLRVRA